MKQDVVNCCIDQGVATLRAVNEYFEDFVRDLGGADSLPKQFTLDVLVMTQMERDIERAIVDGDLQKTEDLCEDYKKRFTAYIDGWRAQIQQKEAAGAAVKP